MPGKKKAKYTIGVPLWVALLFVALLAAGSVVGGILAGQLWLIAFGAFCVLALIWMWVAAHSAKGKVSTDFDKEIALDAIFRYSSTWVSIILGLALIAVFVLAALEARGVIAIDPVLG